MLCSVRLKKVLFGSEVVVNGADVLTLRSVRLKKDLFGPEVVVIGVGVKDVVRPKGSAMKS